MHSSCRVRGLNSPAASVLCACDWGMCRGEVFSTTFKFQVSANSQFIPVNSHGNFPVSKIHGILQPYSHGNRNYPLLIYSSVTHSLASLMHTSVFCGQGAEWGSPLIDDQSITELLAELHTGGWPWARTSSPSYLCQENNDLNGQRNLCSSAHTATNNLTYSQPFSDPLHCWDDFELLCFFPHHALNSSNYWIALFQNLVSIGAPSYRYRWITRGKC